MCRKCLDFHAARSRKWREHNRQRHRDSVKAWKLANPEQTRRREKKSWYRRQYGITIEQRDAMFQKQQGVCAVCGTATALVVDHCHRSGKVRGLLCGKCNAALGMVNDNTSLLLALSDYVREHTA